MSNIIEELTEWAVYHLKGFDNKMLQSNQPSLMNISYKVVKVERSQQRQLTIFDMLERSE